jgi:peptidoglycan hydrolase CwlO-like protein
LKTPGGGAISSAPPPVWRVVDFHPMKSSLRSVSESGHRRSGVFRFLSVCTVGATVAFLANGAVAEPVTPPHARADSPEIAARRKVAELEKQLRDLQAKLGALQAQEPPAPGANATEAQEKEYKQDHLRWQASVDKLQHQIDSVNQQLALARKDLAALQPH